MPVSASVLDLRLSTGVVLRLIGEAGFRRGGIKGGMALAPAPQSDSTVVALERSDFSNSFGDGGKQLVTAESLAVGISVGIIGGGSGLRIGEGGGVAADDRATLVSV